MNRETTLHSSDRLIVVDRSRRRRTILIAAVAAIAALALLAYFLMGSGDEAAGPGGAGGREGAAAAPAVTVVVPGRQSVDRTISATGTLGARREMPIGVAGEGGQVVRVLVEPGSWVGAGQVLAVIDRSVQTQANAQLAANISVARADARLAQQELQRAQALVARGFVSKADVDRRIATRDAANARVRVAEAALRESQARTGRLDIRAPAAGLVLTRDVEPGQVVSAGSGVLFRMARGGEMELLAQLSESDLAVIPVGARAVVTPVGTAREFIGQVWQVAPVINEQSRQGVARVALPYNEALRPGGFASVQIVAGSQQAPILPESAILSDEQGTFVYVVNRANKVERRPVRTGAVTPRGIAVVAGLNGTESVVLRAGGFLNPDETVRPQRQAS